MRDDAHVTLAAGAYVIWGLIVEGGTEFVRASVTFERGLLRTIDRAARAREITRSAFLAAAVRHEMET